MEKILQKAIESSDPVIRSLAAKYKKLLQEKEPLENLFNFYAEALALTEQLKRKVPEVTPQTERPVRAPVGRPPRADKSSDFLESVFRVLRDYGQKNGCEPAMKVNLLYELFYEGQDNPPTEGAFRVRLYKLREQKLIPYDEDASLYYAPEENGADVGNTYAESGSGDSSSGQAT